MSVLGSSTGGRHAGAVLSVLFCVAICGRAFAQATASFPETPGEDVEQASPPEWRADTSEKGAATPTPVPPPPPAPPSAAPPQSPSSGTVQPLPIESASVQAASMDSAYGSDSAAPRLLSTLPYRLPYREGDPVPQGYRVDERAERSLATVGGVLLGAGYLLGVVVGASDDAGSQWMYVPVVGPFAAIANRDVACGDMTTDPQGAQDACVDRVSGEARFLSLALASGLLQLSGATLFVIGMNQSEQTLVPQAGAQLEPRVGTTEVGLDFTGRF